MKLWVIVNRNGNPYFNAWGEGFAAKTRKDCIYMLCAQDAYYSSLKEVWASWQCQGYDCVRVEVKK